MSWPANRPGLNKIENLEPDWWRVQCVGSMPQRLQAVLKARGGAARYWSCVGVFFLFACDSILFRQNWVIFIIFFVPLGLKKLQSLTNTIFRSWFLVVFLSARKCLFEMMLASFRVCDLLFFPTKSNNWMNVLRPGDSIVCQRLLNVLNVFLKLTWNFPLVLRGFLVMLIVRLSLSPRHGGGHSVAAQRAGGQGGVLRPLCGMWVCRPLLPPPPTVALHTVFSLMGVFALQSTGGWTSGWTKPGWPSPRRWRTPCGRARRSEGWATWWSSQRGRSHAIRSGSTTRSTTFRRWVHFLIFFIFYFNLLLLLFCFLLISSI